MRKLMVLVLLMVLAACKKEPDQKAGIPDLVTVDKPLVNQQVETPFQVQGEARGTWFFEADAPMEVTDSKGQVVGRSFITAQGNWMTTEFVPFKGSLDFEVPFGETKGYLIMRKANPSGLPENDQTLRFPIRFSSGK